MTALQPRRDVAVLIIGAGQAGLALAHRLQQSGRSFLLIDAAARVGDPWRRRWDSLRLFTPLAFSRLPGLDYPPGTDALPARDAVADYFERYAEQHGFPLHLGRRVVRLSRVPAPGGLSAQADRGFRAELDDGGTVHAAAVAVATGPYSAPAVPGLAAGLSPQVRQLHSADYSSPADTDEGGVLVVGAANTGAQLSVELHAAGRRVTLAASRPPWFLPTSVLGVGLYPALRASGLLAAPTGGRVHRRLQRRGDPVVGTELRSLLRSGAVRLRPRLVGADGTQARFADGSREVVQTVLWATGYRPALEWLDVPGAVGPDGHPVHVRGVSPVPGLVFVGLPWQARMDSGIICGAEHDAQLVLPALDAPRPAAPSPVGVSL